MIFQLSTSKAPAPPMRLSRPLPDDAASDPMLLRLFESKQHAEHDIQAELVRREWVVPIARIQAIGKGC